MTKLTVKAVQAANFSGTAKKIYDGGGLYLHVKQTSKTWRYSFRIDGRQLVYTIGPEKIISLAEARQLHQQAKALVFKGVNPVDKRRNEKQHRLAQIRATKQKQVTMSYAIDRWFANRSQNWALSNSSKIRYRLNKHIPNWFLNKPVTKVQSSDLIRILNISEGRSIDLVHRLRSYLQDTFDLAVAEELIDANPARHPMVEEAVPRRPKYKNFAHIKQPHVIGEVLSKIDEHKGMPSVNAALRLLPYVFTRPGELRGMRWHEIEWEAQLWRIPAERMKAGKEHIVPLSTQALAIINERKALSDENSLDLRKEQLVFPGKYGTKPFRDMTLLTAMRKLGITNDVIVPHGWRRTASTALNERSFLFQGKTRRFSPDAIECQLAHSISGVRGVYNAADYLDERRDMLQAWADWLDDLKCKACA